MTHPLNYELDFSGRLPASAQDGRQQADDNANSRWRHIFDACVLAAAKKKPEIVPDDVLAEIEALPNPPTTHKMGILKGTDRVKRSERPEKHGNRQNVWVSVYFGGKP